MQMENVQYEEVSFQARERITALTRASADFYPLFLRAHFRFLYSEVNKPPVFTSFNRSDSYKLRHSSSDSCACERYSRLENKHIQRIRKVGNISGLVPPKNSRFSCPHGNKCPARRFLRSGDEVRKILDAKYATRTETNARPSETLPETYSFDFPLPSQKAPLDNILKELNSLIIEKGISSEVTKTVNDMIEDIADSLKRSEELSIPETPIVSESINDNTKKRKNSEKLEELSVHEKSLEKRDDLIETFNGTNEKVESSELSTEIDDKVVETPKVEAVSVCDKTENSVIISEVLQECKDYVVQSEEEGADLPILQGSSKHVLSGDEYVILKYPTVRGMEIRKRDLKFLNPKELLNDTIIDFYLTYVYNEKVPKELQERTHIFNSFFYKKLSAIAFQRNKSANQSVKLEEITDYLKGWTKNVDIFTKDFIFIPINIEEHWYLVAICFIKELWEKDPSANLSSVYMTPEKSPDKRTVESPENKMKCFYPKRRKPCICFFDSVDTRRILSDAKKGVADMLKCILKVLWESKNPKESCDWNNLLCLQVACPQQKNTYDCGLYVLQCVESFFTNPIPYFDDPMPDLKHWFPDIVQKRTEIKKIILSLQEEQAEAPVSKIPDDS